MYSLGTFLASNRCCDSTREVCFSCLHFYSQTLNLSVKQITHTNETLHELSKGLGRTDEGLAADNKEGTAGRKEQKWLRKVVGWWVMVCFTNSSRACGYRCERKCK